MVISIETMTIDCAVRHIRTLFYQCSEDRKADFGETCSQCPHMLESDLRITRMRMEGYGLTVNQSKENLNGCREQMKPGEEGIDGILEILKVYVCDELCCHRGAVTQEEMDQHCCRCKLQQYTDKIREEYEKINAFDQSSTYQIMKKYRKIILCKDCRHRAKLRDDCYRCRKATSLLGTLEDYDGCSRGEEKC